MNFIQKVLFVMLLFFGGVVQAENFPLLRGKIVDEIGVLSYSQRNELQKHLSSMPTFVVAIVHQPFGMGIEEYAKRLFNHWGLNKSEKQDGILMLYVPQKGEYKIEVGAGLKNILTDEVLEDIGDLSFITIGLEKTDKGKTYYKKFLSAYDAIAYIKDHLEENRVVNVKGNLKYSMYQDKVQVHQ